MYSIKFFLSICILFACFHVDAQTKPAKLLRNEADSLYKEGQYRLAAEEYEKYLKLENKDHDALESAGISYFYIHEFEKAKEKFRLAALYCPVEDTETLAGYYSQLSASFSNLNDDEKAYDYALRAYNLNKKSRMNLWNAASLSQNASRHKECIDIMDKAIIPIDNDFHTLYGRCYLALAEYEKSIKHFTTFFDNYEREGLKVDIKPMDERYYMFQSLYYATAQDAISAENKLKYQNEAVKYFNEQTNEKWRKNLMLLMVNNYSSENLSNRYTKGILENIYKHSTLSSVEKMQMAVQLEDYITAQNLASEYVKSHTNNSDDYATAKLTQYIASVNLFVADYKKNKTENKELLNKAGEYLLNFFEKDKDYTKEEMDNTQEFSSLMLHTYQAVGRHYNKKDNNKEEAADVFFKIFSYLPSTEYKQFLTDLKNKK